MPLEAFGEDIEEGVSILVLVDLTLCPILQILLLKSLYVSILVLVDLTSCQCYSKIVQCEHYVSILVLVDLTLCQDGRIIERGDRKSVV